MRKALLLAKMLKKSGAAQDETISQGSNELAVKIVFIVLAAAASILLFILGMSLRIFDGLMDDPTDILRMLYMAGAVGGLFFSIPPVVNSFYMSGDIPVTLVMPLSPIQLVLARLVNVSFLPFAFSFVATLPAGLGYMVTHPFNIGFLLAMLLACVCVPLISISAIAVVIILLMTFVKILRNKDLLRVIGIVIVFGLLVVFYVFYAGDKEMDTAGMQQMAIAASGNNNILPINFALAELMHSFSIVALLEILGITAAFVAACLVVARLFYLDGAIDMQSTGSVQKHLTETTLQKGTSQKSVMKTLIGRELKMVGRNPAYLMTGYLYTFGMPLLMGFVMFMTRSELLSDLDGLKAKLAENPVLGYAILWAASAMFTAIASCMNAHSSTAFSREGDSFFILKLLPISWKEVLKAKQRTALIICSLGSTTYVIIAGIVLSILGFVQLPSVLPALVMNVALLYLCVNVNLMHDIKHPNFTWESEAQMVKKSNNNLLAIVLMFVSIVVPMMVAGISTIGGIIPVVIMAVVTLIYVAISFAFHLHTMKSGVEKLQKL